jgi:DNA helicase-2/ATP-dependent DNA helicase PcrA
MDLHPAVAERLARLAPDQRAAATAPAGPILCVAPAGSGKTTTLVARVAWLVATGADPGRVCAVTFNKRAAEELSARLIDALAPLDVDAKTVRVRTFHALGREILASAGQRVEPLVDRMSLLRRLAPTAGPAAWRRLDDAFSRLKLDLGVTAADVDRAPKPGPVARAFLEYEAALEGLDGLDFDDLVARALRALEADRLLLDRWRTACHDLLVDETQDVDRSQLRLALLLAAPANRIFLVGDDDQTIYGWRLADVRRVIGLADALPGLRRVDLTVNYRCPRPVVERAVTLVACNRERFTKVVRASPSARGRLVLAPDAADDHLRIARVVDSWPADGGTRAILARTNRELLPAVVVALDRGMPFRAPPLPMPLDAPDLDAVLEAAALTPPAWPLLRRLAAAEPRPSEPRIGEGRRGGGAAGATDRPDERRLPPTKSADPAAPRDRPDDGTHDAEEAAPTGADLVRHLLAWAAPFDDLAPFAAEVRARRSRLAELRRDDADLTLATAHATKGLEFDHVCVIGLDAGRFPSARSLSEAADPGRALEEERRLAYVAWTRARRSLTLVYDPAAPSRFLLEAFTPEELGVTARP